MAGRVVGRVVGLEAAAAERRTTIERREKLIETFSLWEHVTLAKCSVMNGHEQRRSRFVPKKH